MNSPTRERRLRPARLHCGAPVVEAIRTPMKESPPMPTLKLPDGSLREVPAGARSRDVAEAIGKRLAKDAVAAKVDGVIVDLDRELPEGEVSFAVLTPKDPEALEVLRHSSAHIMARAVMRLFPGTQLAFGPPLENGFYYDIDSPTPLTEADFPRIEVEMRKIIADAE